MVEIQINDKSEKLNAKLTELVGELGKFSIPLKKSGLIMIRSVDRNFREQGRPSKWAPLSPATLAIRGRKRKSKISAKVKARREALKPGSTSPKILQDSGDLKHSVTMRVEGRDAVTIGVRGGPFKYGKLHQYGGTIRMFGKHTVNVPKRKFILFQESDKKEIDKVFIKDINDSVKTVFAAERGA